MNVIIWLEKGRFYIFPTREYLLIWFTSITHREVEQENEEILKEEERGREKREKLLNYITIFCFLNRIENKKKYFLEKKDKNQEVKEKIQIMEEMMKLLSESMEEKKQLHVEKQQKTYYSIFCKHLYDSDLIVKKCWNYIKIVCFHT